MEKNDHLCSFLWSEENIRDCYGRRKFAIDYAKTGLLDYEQKMLRYAKCSSFLEISVMAEGEVKKVYYDITGMVPLLQHIHQHDERKFSRDDLEIVDDALCVLLNILKGLKHGDDYLLPASRTPLVPEIIFIHPVSKQAVFAYLPGLCEAQSLQTRILWLMDELERNYHQEMVSSHYEKLKKAISERNLGLEEMISTLSTIQRESSSTQWIAPSFRQKEVEEQEKEQPDLMRGKLPEIKKEEKKENPYFMFLIVQLIFCGILTIIFISNILDFFSFLGFCAIAIGVDLWISKSLVGFLRTRRRAKDR